MSFLSARMTKLRVAIGAGAIALGLAAAAGAATPAQADDGWHNGYRARLERIERERAIARERAREAARRQARYEHHRFAQVPPPRTVAPPHAPWYFR